MTAFEGRRAEGGTSSIALAVAVVAVLEALLVAHESAVAQTFVDAEHGFTADLGLLGGCVIIPRERRVAERCEGFDVASGETQLGALQPSAASMLWLSIHPSGETFFIVSLLAIHDDGFDRWTREDLDTYHDSHVRGNEQRAGAPASTSQWTDGRMYALTWRGRTPVLESNLQFDVDEQHHPERWMWGTVSLRAFFSPESAYVLTATGGVASHADARQAVDRVAATVELPPMPGKHTFGQTRIDRLADSMAELSTSCTFAVGILALVIGLAIHDKQKRKQRVLAGSAAGAHAVPAASESPASPAHVGAPPPLEPPLPRTPPTEAAPPQEADLLPGQPKTEPPADER